MVYSASEDSKSLEEENSKEPIEEEVEEPKQCKENIALEEEGPENPTDGNDDDTQVDLS